MSRDFFLYKGAIIDRTELAGFHISNYNGLFMEKIEILAFDMGANCGNNRGEFDRNAEKLSIIINGVPNKTDQDNLFKYVNMIMKRTANYFFLNK